MSSSAKEVVRQMIREAVRSRMGLLTEGDETATLGDYSITLSGPTVDEISVAYTLKEGTELLRIDAHPSSVTSPDSSDWMHWSKEDHTNDSFPSPVLLDWFKDKDPGIYVVKVTFGTWDGVTSQGTETARLQASIFLRAAASGESSAGSSVGSGDAASGASDSSTATDAAAAPLPPTAPAAGSTEAPPPTPQVSSMTMQDKIKKSVSAVSREFQDKEDAPISLDDVKKENSFTGFTWVENADGARKPYNLNDWSSGQGYTDQYTYFALVDDKSKKPVAFVVASDPMEDNHFSTGRYIGITSARPSLRDAFCVLYHRATGEVHPQCRDGATPGTEDDKYGKGGGGKGSKGGKGSDSSTPGTATGAGAARLVAKDGIPVRGRGDAMTGILGIGLRPAEKLRGAGYKIITKSKDKQGFTSFPDGPDRMFKRDPAFTAGGRIPPSSLAVRFKKPMAIITDSQGLNPRINFGENKSAEDILFIRLGWGGRGVRLVKLSPGKPGFDEAAAWVLANQAEFDLSPDGVQIEKPVDASSDGGKAAGGAGVMPAENRGMSLGEGTSRRAPSLLDLYRF